MEKKLKILIIPNVIDNWSADLRCNQLIKHLGDQFEFTKFQGYMSDPLQMSAQIAEHDITHFLTSGAYLNPYYEILFNVKKPIIYSIVSHRSMDELGPNIKKMIKEKFYVVSFNRFLEKEFGGRYIPNGVDLSIFNKKLVGGFVGVKSDYKGVDLMKQACEELDIEFKPDPSDYPNKILTQEELVKTYYPTIDFLMCASIAEGSHNPTMEALAQYIPVITTKIGIAPELKKEGYDITFIEKRSVKGIKKAICKRFPSMKPYSWGKVAKIYAKLYEEVYGDFNSKKVSK